MKELHSLVDNNFVGIVAALFIALVGPMVPKQIAKYVYVVCAVLLVTAVSFKFLYHPNYYKEALQWAVENGVTDQSKDSFRPNDTCSRGNFMEFLYRSYQKPVILTDKSPYSDLNEGDQYADAAFWAFKKNLVDGGEFNAARPISRGGAISCLYQLWQQEGGTSYTSAVKWAADQKITDEEPFDGARPCTRANAITFIYRYFKALEK